MTTADEYDRLLAVLLDGRVVARVLAEHRPIRGGCSCGHNKGSGSMKRRHVARQIGREVADEAGVWPLPEGAYARLREAMG